MTMEVALPSMVRQAIWEQGAKMLQRHSHRFGSMLLHLHFKPTGSQIECDASLFTDGGRYHAHNEDWDVRRAVDSSLDALDLQVTKHFDRRVTLAQV